MAYVWSDSLATGNPCMDLEHRTLLEQVNRLLGAMREGRGKDAIEPMLAFLARYADEHFRHEEAAFARLDCPVKLENAREHAQFRKTLAELQARYARDGGSAALSIDLKNRLGDWLVSHIQRLDRELGAMARAA
ncbi:MAG: hemerythrin family protein [Fimbriimonadales bacterium]|nr:hemerythrin family protein [Fimbriimonadales bacterium]